MPRSRSRSMASSTCASISRAWRAPVISRNRSASVDLPWSICAMTEKLRIRCGSTTPSARFEGHETLRIRRPDVLGARPDQPVVRVLFEHVGGPPRYAADRENRREEINRNAEDVIGRRRIEVHVRIELLLGLDERLDPFR